jgi:MprA protease rhombosortase-interaction domain-containing protein
MLLALIAATPFSALAHETRTVATDYEFVVGFINEPAIQGDTNGIWVKITKGDQPVLGAADTLQAQVSTGDQVKDMTLTPAFGEDGVYESVFIPTQPGDYTFRFFGDLGGVAVDETFTSSPEGFDSVAPRSDFEFPSATPGSGAYQDKDGSLDLAFPVIGGGLVLVAGTVGFAIRRRDS